MKIYQFAYGSNMNLKRMSARMNSKGGKLSKYAPGKFSILGPGVLNNWVLKFNTVWKGSVYANIIKESGSIVEGVIYELDSNALKRLDYFEDFPNNYLRKVMKVNYFDKNTGKIRLISCFVYVANSKTISDGFLPEKKYFSNILKGKKYLSKTYYTGLLKIKTK